ncbi:MAG: indole-3-glycerol phosphate synthase TrpC [Tepidisphaeraceae bacterium]
MHTILDKIVATKKFEVAERSLITPVDELKKMIRDQEPPRNFFQAIAKDPVGKIVNVIAECKKASPSAGVLVDDYDPAAIAQRYAEGGADAISCLTDEKYFHGHLDHLKAVRAAVSLPVLRKDFVIDPYQVYEARAAGADAILLIAECLPATNTMIDLQILATELKMTVLIEVHDIENFIRVRDSVIGFPHRSYSLLGINNRDLRNFKTDLGTTLRMMDMVEDPTVLVSESGIHTREHVTKLAAANVHGVLVGESLMRAGPDVVATMRELFKA